MSEVYASEVRLWVYASEAILDGRWLCLKTEDGVVMVQLPAEGITEEE